MRDDTCPVSRSCISRQDRVLRLAASREGSSFAMLAAETGIPEPTLRSYTDRPSRPAQMMPYSAVVKLLRALPDDLADLLIEESGYALKPRDTADKDWLGFAERTATFSAKVLRYQSTDGMIDHREDADLTNEARELASHAQGMVGQ